MASNVFERHSVCVCVCVCVNINPIFQFVNAFTAFTACRTERHINSELSSLSCATHVDKSYCFLASIFHLLAASRRKN